MLKQLYLLIVLTTTAIIFPAAAPLELQTPQEDCQKCAQAALKCAKAAEDVQEMQNIMARERNEFALQKLQAAQELHALKEKHTQEKAQQKLEISNELNRLKETGIHQDKSNLLQKFGFACFASALASAYYVKFFWKTNKNLPPFTITTPVGLSAVGTLGSAYLWYRNKQKNSSNITLDGMITKLQNNTSPTM